MAIYYRPPTNPDGSKMNFQERRAARRATERQQEQPAPRPDLYNLSSDQRRAMRRSEEQGRREGARCAAIEEQAKRQAEYDALPEHEKRPPNPWRELIEKRKPDAWRKDVARRIKIYEREARIEDERIDALMAEKKKRYDLETAPEYARALAHWERASMNADTEEQTELARLKGLIDGGGANEYWDQVAPLMQSRLHKVQSAVIEHAARQEPLAQEAAALADKQKIAEELQVKEPAVTEATEDVHPLMRAWENRTATAT